MFLATQPSRKQVRTQLPTIPNIVPIVGSDKNNHLPPPIIRPFVVRDDEEQPCPQSIVCGEKALSKSILDAEPR
jgi:hypothetical protein